MTDWSVTSIASTGFRDLLCPVRFGEPDLTEEDVAQHRRRSRIQRAAAIALQRGAAVCRRLNTFGGADAHRFDRYEVSSAYLNELVTEALDGLTARFND
jgi:hypothetical protein